LPSLHRPLSQVYWSIPAEYCERYAKAEDIGKSLEEDSSEGDMSDDEHISSDEEMAGHADP
jgi:ubiquitin-conjugating enzyme E2 H